MDFVSITGNHRLHAALQTGGTEKLGTSCNLSCPCSNGQFRKFNRRQLKTAITKGFFVFRSVYRDKCRSVEKHSSAVYPDASKVYDMLRLSVTARLSYISVAIGEHRLPGTKSWFDVTASLNAANMAFWSRWRSMKLKRVVFHEESEEVDDAGQKLLIGRGENGLSVPHVEAVAVFRISSILRTFLSHWRNDGLCQRLSN